LNQLFQARALLGQAKVLKRRGAAPTEVKAAAGEACKIASAVGWTQGRADAEALVAGWALPLTRASGQSRGRFRAWLT
jgi:hypothetical protein